MTSDLGRRIAFTVGALVVCRIGSFIPLPVPPGAEPGEGAAAHLDRVPSRITVVGTACLAVVFLIPEFLISYTRVPYCVDVASAMIVACMILDITTQLRNEASMTFGGDRT